MHSEAGITPTLSTRFPLTRKAEVPSEIAIATATSRKTASKPDAVDQRRLKSAGGPLSDSRLVWIAKRMSIGESVNDSHIEALPNNHQAVLAKLRSCEAIRVRTVFEVALQEIGLPNCSDLLEEFDDCDPYGVDPAQAKTMADVANVVGGVQWLWEPWIPQGLVTIVAAQPGVGKSTLVLDSIARSVIHGTPFLDGSPATERGKVLWCDTEAAHAGNVDRIHDWGLDGSSLLVPGVDELEGFRVDRTKHMDRVRELSYYNNVKLIVIDSLRNAHIGNENDSGHMTKIMNRLAELAQHLGVAVIAIHHMGKPSKDPEAAPPTLRGSSAILALARSVIVLKRSTLNRETIVVESDKCNFARQPANLAFEIVGAGVNPVAAPAIISKKSKREAASEFILDQLKDGPVRATLILKMALEEGFSEPTLVRAKGDLGFIKSGRVGEVSYWWNSSLAAKLELGPTAEKVDDVDNLESTLGSPSEFSQLDREVLPAHELGLAIHGSDPPDLPVNLSKRQEEM